MRPLPLLLAGLLVLASLAATAGLLIRVPCPHCLGKGLVTEPPAEVRETRWIRARDLTPVPCWCCGNRFKVGLFRKWRWIDLMPEPPFHQKDAETFTETRRARIAHLRDEAVRWEDREDSDPLPSSRPDLLPVLAQALEDEDGKVRAHAMRAIAEMNLEEALPILVAGARSDDGNAQAHACRGLGWLGRSASLRDAAVAALTKVLESEDVDEFQVRLQAATSLFDLGALPSANFFIQATKEKQLSRPSEWEFARKVFVRFRTKEALSLLVIAMGNVRPEEKSGYGRDLETITGQSFGDDPVKWYRWLEKNRASLPPQIE